MRLSARSLSLQDLRAKSREHGSYGLEDVPFWEWTASKPSAFRPNRQYSRHPGRGEVALGRLSKTYYYLVDNILHNRLSGLKGAVNGKRVVAQCDKEASQGGRLLRRKYAFLGITIKLRLRSSGVGKLRNSCRPLRRTRPVPLSLSRYCRAGLSDAAATRLEQSLSHCRVPSSFVTIDLTWDFASSSSALGWPTLDGDSGIVP